MKPEEFGLYGHDKRWARGVCACPRLCLQVLRSHNCAVVVADSGRGDRLQAAVRRNRFGAFLQKELFFFWRYLVA